MSEEDEYDPREDAYRRSIHIRDPRVDQQIFSLCEQHGYGAVMDSAMRQYIKKDPMGAFYIGGCLGYRDGKPAELSHPPKSKSPPNNPDNEGERE